MKEKIQAIIQLYQTLQVKDTVYLVSKSQMDSFIVQAKLEAKEKFHMKPINHDLIEEMSNIIQYQDDAYNSFIKANLKLNKDYVYVTEELWKLLNVIILYMKSLFEGYPIKRYLKEDQSISKFMTFKLFPIYQGQTNFLEGVQQFDSSWTLQEIINNMEQAMQNQILLQVPQKNFIRFYVLKKAYWDISTLIEKIQKRELEIQPLQCPLNELNEGQFLIMDICLLNKNYVFQEQTIQETITFVPEQNDFSRYGKSVFENQNTLQSCMLKCYECIDVLRNKVFKGQNSNLKELLMESWFGYQEYVLYDPLDYEFFEEKQVTIKEARYDAIYIYKNENRVIINHMKNIRQLVEKLLGHPQLQCDFNSVLFECSNENYTETIDFNLPANHLKKGYTYQLRKLMPLEQNINNQDKIELKINRCTFQNEGYPEYINFEPIYKCFISKWSTFHDLHLLIANLFEYVSFDHYTNNVWNKDYQLYYQTDQQGGEKCTYCKQKLCNNCLVPFNEQKISFNKNQITIYAVCKQAKQYLQKFVPQPIEQYYLRDYFDVDWAHDEFLILNINQEEISPTKVRYYFDSYHYQLKGIIEKVGEDYQCYILLDQWYKNGKSIDQPSDCLNAVKLFYVRK